jgi:predicted ATPase
LAGTLYFMGDFETARHDAMHALQIWRSGGVRYQVEEVFAPAITSLCYEAMVEWHFGEIASSHATMAEAISLAKELNDMHGLANALHYAGFLAHFEGNPAEVKHCASDLIELSTRQNFAFWLAGGKILRGWARSASGDTAEGISWIEDRIEDWREIGTILMVPYFLALKAEALHLADRTSEALEAINARQFKHRMTSTSSALSQRPCTTWWETNIPSF